MHLEMNTPKAFGWFHLMWIFLSFISIFALYKMKKSEKLLKYVLGVYGIIALILELLKQISWTFEMQKGVLVADYSWYAFPFQLCTTPIYVSLISMFMKKSKTRNALLSFMAYITILGSISTILLPDSCFVSDILVNVHTMWLHLGSFVVSVYLLMSGDVEISLPTLFSGIIAFVAFVMFALVLNVAVYNSGVLNGETFNMFYISPYFISSLPVFDVIQQNVPYILFLVIYIFALSLGGFIIYSIAKGISKLKWSK